ncbi:hypothetical protein HSX37_02485|nr:hypothetical protein [Dendrosporobacter quercicolus]NSL46921.1 hypothetical protein [Dendrosporobacter quercicolus DSM 1736]
MNSYCSRKKAAISRKELKTEAVTITPALLESPGTGAGGLPSGVRRRLA